MISFACHPRENGNPQWSRQGRLYSRLGGNDEQKEVGRQTLAAEQSEDEW
ncbi:MAG: hypothetical protein KQH63_20455 [Desulfobulbaceae bacterium]|nr:hypothetical protein [Desulfobulbaceae bacterium]